MKSCIKAVGRTGAFGVGLVVLTLLLTFFADAAYAQIPKTINYQGRLKKVTGEVVNGIFDVTFAIYDRQNSGTSLYTEVHLDVVVTDGEFSVEIGSVTPLELPFDQPYFLGIKVGTDQEMSPRTPFTSVGYALHALRAQNSDKADKADRATGADKADRATGADKADRATGADKADVADVATRALNADVAGRAGSALRADSAALADVATRATNADLATRALNADAAARAGSALRADSAALADVATRAMNADLATRALSADAAARAGSAALADLATRATNADAAARAGSAALADLATRATNADAAVRAGSAALADLATRATNADVATRATNADFATLSDTTLFALGVTQGRVAIVADSFRGGTPPLGSAFYTDPVAAMNDYARWCGTPSAQSPCLLKIMPGLYDLGTESLQMRSYVDVEGSGENVTVLRGSSSSGVVRTANYSAIRFLTIDADSANSIGLLSAGSANVSHMTFVCEYQCISATNQGYVSISRTHIQAQYGGITATTSLLDVNDVTIAVYNPSGWASGIAAPGALIRNSSIEVSGTQSDSVGVLTWNDNTTLENVTVRSSHVGLQANSGDVRIHRSTIEGGTYSIRVATPNLVVRVGTSGLGGQLGGGPVNIKCGASFSTVHYGSLNAVCGNIMQ